MHEGDPTMTEEPGRETLEREAQEWLLRLTSGRATPADADALRRWCGRSSAHAEAFAEANLLWEGLGPVARAMVKSGALAQAKSAGMPALGRRAFLGGSMAASIVAAGYLAMRPPLNLWPSAYELAADYRTETGERQRIAIENGVSIDLNTRTSLNIRHQGDEPRVELLSGEAAITVAQKLSQPLIVSSAGGLIHGSDAQFDVRCDGLRTTVTCHRGSVGIDYSGQSVSLGEGRQISYADGGFGSERIIDPTVVMAWREGHLVFRGTPLSEVIEEVNRYRSGRIVLMNEALGKRRVEARISLDHLDDLIALVREAYGPRVTSLPGGVLILS